MKKRKRITNPMGPTAPKHQTRQQPKEMTDINAIVEKAKRGIAPTWINQRTPIYANMTQVPRDLMEAYQQIDKAEQAFMALPAKIRTQIDNNPERLPDWLRKPENRETAEEYGLITKKPGGTPQTPSGGVEPPPAHKEKEKEKEK